MVAEAAVFLLEDTGIVALRRVAVGIVLPVFLDRIDEEQAQDLDALRGESLLFVEVLFDGAVDHLALHGQRFHVAIGMAEAQVLLAAGAAELEIFVAPRHSYSAHPAIGIDRPPCGHFQIVAVLHGDFLAGYSMCGLRIEFHFSGDDTPQILHRKQLHISFVVSAFHRGRGHFDLLHQLALVGIHRIELEHHVMRLFGRGGIA